MNLFKVIPVIHGRPRTRLCGLLYLSSQHSSHLLKISLRFQVLLGKSVLLHVSILGCLQLGRPHLQSQQIVPHPIQPIVVLLIDLLHYPSLPTVHAVSLLLSSSSLSPERGILSNDRRNSASSHHSIYPSI